MAFHRGGSAGIRPVPMALIIIGHVALAWSLLTQMVDRRAATPNRPMAVFDIASPAPKPASPERLPPVEKPVVRQRPVMLPAARIVLPAARTVEAGSPAAPPSDPATVPPPVPSREIARTPPSKPVPAKLRPAEPSTRQAFASRLIGHLRRHRQYPRRSRTLRQEGVVMIAFLAAGRDRGGQAPPFRGARRRVHHQP